MPLFSIFCAKCKTTTEELVKNSDTICKCPTCGKDAKKLVSKASFKVNGASYANGYTSEGPPASTSETSGPVVRTPIIKDRKTDKVIGMGETQVMAPSKEE